MASFSKSTRKHHSKFSLCLQAFLRWPIARVIPAVLGFREAGRTFGTAGTDGAKPGIVRDQTNLELFRLLVEVTKSCVLYEESCFTVGNAVYGCGKLCASEPSSNRINTARILRGPSDVGVGSRQ
jgi:hypothetical protein